MHACYVCSPSSSYTLPKSAPCIDRIIYASLCGRRLRRATFWVPACCSPDMRSARQVGGQPAEAAWIPCRSCHFSSSTCGMTVPSFVAHRPDKSQNYSITIWQLPLPFVLCAVINGGRHLHYPPTHEPLLVWPTFDQLDVAWNHPLLPPYRCLQAGTATSAAGVRSALRAALHCGALAASVMATLR